MKRKYHAAKQRLEGFLPHTLAHLLIASLINIFTLSLSRGGAFYLGREVANWEDRHDFAKGRFRWDDLLWPLLPWFAVEIVVKTYIAYIILEKFGFV